MQPGKPSDTARGAAAYRAIHQTVEGGAIFADPFAASMLDDEARARLDEAAANASLRPMRLFIAARSRLSEDTLAACVGRGVRQVVILGAGLDTFALRNPYEALGVRVFEVDNVASQNWKLERLTAACLSKPDSLTFVPVDFERESLAECLGAAGFDAHRAAFFQWLGVLPYLTREAVSSTLDFIAGVPDSEVVFDYAEPLDNYPADRRAHIKALAALTASRGEPWLSMFDPLELSEMLAKKRFQSIEDLGLAEISARFYGALATDIPRGPGGHLVRARTML